MKARFGKVQDRIKELVLKGVLHFRAARGRKGKHFLGKATLSLADEERSSLESALARQLTCLREIRTPEWWNW